MNIDKEIIVYILSFTAFMNMLFAWRMYKSDTRSPVTIFFAISLFFTVWWTVATIGFHTSNDPALISIGARLSYATGLLATICFYMFTCFFPYFGQSIKFKSYHFALLIGSIISLGKVVWFVKTLKGVV